MKQDFKLSFVKAKKLQPLTNSERNLVLRQQYALKMLKILNEGKRVINVDESWLKETSFIR